MGVGRGNAAQGGNRHDGSISTAVKRALVAAMPAVTAVSCVQRSPVRRHVLAGPPLPLGVAAGGIIGPGVSTSAAVRSVLVVVVVDVTAAVVLVGASLLCAAFGVSRGGATACSAGGGRSCTGRPGTTPVQGAIKLVALRGQHFGRVRWSGRGSCGGGGGGRCSGVSRSIGIGLEPVVKERTRGCLCIFPCSTLKQLLTIPYVVQPVVGWDGME